ncbi:MAG: hypothetical protein ACOWWH_06300 [Eubacteriaceae bacterium]
MVRVVSGPKGSGKTKKIIQMANDKIKESMGEIVFINDREKYRVKLNKVIRYVNAHDFYIFSTEMLFGFLNGLIAENYDIDIVYIDNLIRITKVKSLDELDEFLKGLNMIERKYNVQFVLSISTDKNEIPEIIKEYAIN